MQGINNHRLKTQLEETLRERDTIKRLMEIMYIKDKERTSQICLVEFLEEKHEQWKKTQIFKVIIQGNFLIIKYVTVHIENMLCVPGKIAPHRQQQKL